MSPPNGREHTSVQDTGTKVQKNPETAGGIVVRLAAIWPKAVREWFTRSGNLSPETAISHLISSLKLREEGIYKSRGYSFPPSL